MRWVTRKLMRKLERRKRVSGPLRKLAIVLRDVLNKRVTLPVWAIVLLVLGALYVISPLDSLPDFIPLLGFLDDALMSLFILNKIMPHAKVNERRENRARDLVPIARNEYGTIYAPRNYGR